MKILKIFVKTLTLKIAFYLQVLNLFVESKISFANQKLTYNN